MPRKFTFLSNMSRNGRGRARQYFSGPSFWQDVKSGQRIEIPKGTIFSKYEQSGKWARYARNENGRAVLDIEQLRRAQLRGRVNQFPERAGTNNMFVPLNAAVWHLRDITFRKIKVQKLKFEVDVAKVAAEVFRDSFKKKRFNTRGSERWKPFAPYTVRQRAKHGTNPSNILVDTGTLRKSIKAVPNEGKVVIDPTVYVGSRRHKGFVYAGIHNDPKYFGARNVMARNHEVPQRQFMGHSSVVREYAWLAFEIDMFGLLFTPIV